MTTTAITALPWRRAIRWPFLMRWVRPLVMAALVLTLGVAGHPQDRPGLSGRHLLILVATVCVLAGCLGSLHLAVRPWVGMSARLVPLVVVLGGSAVLIWAGPVELGYVGAFVTVAVAAAQLPRAPGAVAACATALAIGCADVIGARAEIGAAVVTEISLLGFYRLGRYARRLRARTAQAERLVAELEGTRAAQAQAAALDERQRIAREMHDVLAHSLSGLIIALEAARLLATQSAGDPAVAEAIGRARWLGIAGLREARAAIGSLRNDALPGPELIADLAAQFERDTGVSCRFTSDGIAPTLDPRARLTMYRVAQEALTNVARHARPTRVEVCLRQTSSGTSLVVDDDGGWTSGGAPTAVGGGYGLTGMRERADLIGARLTAAPTATGFRVELLIPS